MNTGKINRTPDEAALVLTMEDLLWLRTEWLSRGKIADSTRQSYEQKTGHFAKWWRAQGLDADWRLTKRLLIKFEEHLCSLISPHTNKPLSWWTRHGALRHLSEMFGWGISNGFVEGIDVRPWFPPATGEAPERKAPTIEHLWRLMDVVAKDARYSLRNQTILALFIGTGIRMTELINLKAEHIVFCADNSGVADVTGKRTVAKRSGKRTVAFDAFTGRYMAAYLDSVLITEGPLFYNERDNIPLGRNGVYKMVKKAIKDAGLTGYVQSPHDFRRAFTTILSLHDVNDAVFLDMLRRQLGHKNYKMTAEYTKITAEHIRERIVSPLALNGRSGIE